MAWIAEEIEAEIAAGRMVEKDVIKGQLSRKGIEEIQAEITAWPLMEHEIKGQRGRKGLWVEEFTDNDRLAIALRIVLERAQVGHAVSVELTERLNRHLGVQNIDYVDVEGDLVVRFQPFSPAIGQAVEELAGVLRRVASECALHGSDVDRLSARPTPATWGGE